MNASAVVTTLVDIVSKNGNFLLDVGPRADGTIIDIEQEALRGAGTWIKSHAEAIFNTTYYYIAAQEGDLRFTRSDSAFYIHSLKSPNATMQIHTKLPLLNGDSITMVGINDSTPLVWNQTTDVVTIQVPSDVASKDQYAWVFKITY